MFLVFCKRLQQFISSKWGWKLSITPHNILSVILVTALMQSFTPNMFAKRGWKSSFLRHTHKKKNGSGQPVDTTLTINN